MSIENFSVRLRPEYLVRFREIHSVVNNTTDQRVSQRQILEFLISVVDDGLIKEIVQKYS